MEWRVEHLEQVGSTNTWLKDRALEGAPEGLVVYADVQSAGRGRLDRQWESAAGSSLLCSMLVRPTLPRDRLQLVVAAVALSARAAVADLSGVQPDLKWPNDLVVNDDKLAGLLAEVVSTDRGLAVVVGVGINLTQHPVDTHATDVREVSGVALQPRSLLDTLLERLTPRCAQLERDEGRVEMTRDYSGALATLGRRVRVLGRDGEQVGRALRVDASGHLVVKVDGVEMTFSAGDVVHVRTDTSDDQ